MRKFSLIISLIACQILNGQTPFNYQIDFKNILEKTQDMDNSLFYDKLLSRFSVNDTTLTDQEVLALLIGYTAKPEYKPYSDISTERYIYKLNDEQKFKEALDEGIKFLKTHPVSVKALFEIAYSYHKLGADDSAQYYAYKGRRIFEAMFYSGDGMTPETPTFALGPADGQDYILKYVGAEIGTMGSGSDKNGNFLDILQAKFDNGQIVTLYFIIQHATDKMFSEDELKIMKGQDD